MTMTVDSSGPPGDLSVEEDASILQGLSLTSSNDKNEAIWLKNKVLTPI
jgi:hypothetical protein